MYLTDRFVATQTAILVIFLGLSAAFADPVAIGKADADAPKEWTATDSGLKYRVLRKSDGAKATDRDGVTVHYKGWLPEGEGGAEGKTFDSSYQRGKPISFNLNEVIPGWTEGMQLVGKGGMIELEIPSKLGYGERGAGGAIPPNATLRFIVELIDIKEGPKPVNIGARDADAAKEWTSTDSGLKYRILRKSDGEKPTAENAVTVHYKGWLPDADNGDNGKTFDSSYDRGEPISFPLGRVIPGWTEGMQLVGKGGMIELHIPPNLGYGAAGAGGAIPPNATLRFIVELIEVK